MAENNNWLSQLGHEITDVEFRELGISDDMIGSENFNRVMLDKVHAENLAGYIATGLNEKQARHKADKQRSMALKAAKAAGLKL
jgi:hypothetical protein